MLALPPISLYVHVPWCVKKCPYCDFNSHVEQQIDEKLYLEMLLNDLKADLVYIQCRTIVSIFIGGGTPSLLSPEFYTSLMRSLHELLDFESDIEITMEANPGTTDFKKFEGFRNAGINRLSLGIQSFDDDKLLALGRVHDSNQALQAVKQARLAGFENINLDLMHGLPDQDAEEALSDVAQALALGPQHISWYQLTVEPNTEFYSRPPSIPAEDTLWEIQERGQGMLAQAGYRQYEISAYARNGCRSKHNLNYWSFGDYLGIGAGAHGKVTLLEAQQALRYRKTRVPRDYLKLKPQHRIGQIIISDSDLTIEFMLNVLRLTEGVETELYSLRTGLALEKIVPVLEDLRRKELMRNDRLALTPRGQLFLNEVLAYF